jgi:hypothetical protein
MPEEPERTAAPWELDFPPEEVEFVRSRLDDPAELIARLRREGDFAIELARADTRPILVSWFRQMGIERREGGWSHDPERTGPIGPSAVGVEWNWVGKHDENDKEGRTFNDIAPSGRNVTVHGFTLMGAEDGRFMVRRYIDWAGLFAQLGLSLNWRTPVASEPPDREEPEDEEPGA